MTIFFTQDAVSNLNLEGTIGAFYINDNGDYNCGASMSFNGDQTQFAVMGDDSTTPQKDGFHAGEIIYWFFQAEDGSILSLEIDPADSFELNAISIVSSVNVNEVDCGDDVVNNGCETLDYNYTNTGVNMTFALPNSSIESISNLGNGSIGIFFSTNNDELICAGSSSLNGLETAFPIMGDDQTTMEVDGLINNQELLILFTATNGNQYLLTPYPTENFIPNGIYYVDEFEASLYCASSNDIYGCMDEAANNYNSNANLQDNSCTYDIEGCTDYQANNYNPQANIEDDSCAYDIYGCTDEEANNYNASANINDYSCTYDVEGCTDINSCNFNADAVIDDGSCIYGTDGNAAEFSISPASWGGEAMDMNNVSIIHVGESLELGCDSYEFNFEGAIALIKRGDCQFSQKALHAQNAGAAAVIIYNYSSGNISMGQGSYSDEIIIPVYAMNGNDGSELSSWVESTSNNNANIQEHTLYIATAAFDCEGNCLNDEDQDGVCDESEVIGCQDQIACNYNSLATDSGDCTYTDTYYNCEGNCITDADDNGVCDELEIEGCMDTEANNYNADANTEDESCTYDVYGCMDTEANNYNADANTEDESCTYDVYGCMDTEANNYNADANTEDESCTYDVYGCMDTEANNYNADANTEDESCTYDQDNCGCSDANYIEYFTQGYYAACDDGSCEIPIQSSGITNNHFNTPLNTSVNSTLGFDLSSIYLPEGTIFGAFYDLNNDGQIAENPVVSSMDEVYYECVGISNYENSFFTMAIWGDDPFSDDIDGVPSGSEDVIFAFLLPDQSVITFDFSPEIFIFTSNGLMAVSSINLDLTVYGCTNAEACNFNIYADIEDGSCSGSYGCMEEMYVDFDEEASCHSEELCDDTWHDHLVDMEETHGEVLAALDSSIALNNALTLELNNQTQISNSLENELVLANNTITDNEEEIASLLNDIFAISSNLDDANTNIAEIMYQLTEALTDNENLLSIIDDLTIANSVLSDMLDQANTTIVSMENEMLNMQSNMDSTLAMLTLSQENSQQLSIIIADMTNQISEANETISDMSVTINNLNEENIVMQSTMTSLEEINMGMTDEIESLEMQNTEAQESIITLSYQLEEMIMLNESMSLANDSLSAPILIDFISGWNIIGYTLRNPQDAVISFETIEENLSVVKNNAGEVYWTDFGYNGIGDLIPGQGYQVLVNGDHEGFVFEDMGGLRVELSPTVPQWAVDMEIPIHPNDVRTLVRVVNILGQSVNAGNEVKGSLLYYLYNDGSVEKRMK